MEWLAYGQQVRLAHTRTLWASHGVCSLINVVPDELTCTSCPTLPVPNALLQGFGGCFAEGLSPGGQYVAVQTSRREPPDTVVVMDIASSAVLAPELVHDACYEPFCFEQSGKCVAVLCSRYDVVEDSGVMPDERVRQASLKVIDLITGHTICNSSSSCLLDHIAVREWRGNTEVMEGDKNPGATIIHLGQAEGCYWAVVDASNLEVLQVLGMEKDWAGSMIRDLKLSSHGSKLANLEQRNFHSNTLNLSDTNTSSRGQTLCTARSAKGKYDHIQMEWVPDDRFLLHMYGCEDNPYNLCTTAIFDTCTGHALTHFDRMAMAMPSTLWAPDMCSLAYLTAAGATIAVLVEP